MGIHVAAVDLGATSGRVMRAVVSDDPVEMVEVARFPNGPVQRADGLHWDIEALRGHIMEGLRQAFADDPLITSIGIDSWAVDYALMAGGRMLGEPFHYRDGRTARGVAAVHAVVPPDELYTASGLQHLPFNTVFQLAAETPETLGVAEVMLLIPDLVAFWLTGRAVAETTNASTTGLLDPHTGVWNEALIARLGLPRGLFAELVRPGDAIGGLTPAIAAELGAPEGVVVTAVGSHDTASAVVGVPMTRPDAAYISCGTWGLVGLELEHPVISDAARAANFTNEGGVDGRVRFLHNVMGLWLLSETIREWEAESGRVDLGRLLADAAAVVRPVPTFNVNDPRLLAPGDMASRIATVIAVRGDAVPASRAELARAILESLALAFASAVRTASALADRPVSVIHLVGGGALNALLCQLTADRAGMPVLAGPVEATALGNVLVQARAQGPRGTLEDVRRLVAEQCTITSFSPRPVRVTA
ncbi:rhamnulokinase family protein [Yonghaparkia sp. Soil809]|uniref:rhamnulokinase n=1 Tax=Yonghaparkia sp. Soil809 TaxID=1736417 RepID=UPI0006F98536|nr:rhamnulokinase family protein [Yonghaparkia sp. Soil809]KRF33183.1 carbohydrate kinase [Yonghaparkia sp. Soil809]